MRSVKVQDTGTDSLGPCSLVVQEQWILLSIFHSEVKPLALFGTITTFEGQVPIMMSFIC